MVVNKINYISLMFGLLISGYSFSQQKELKESMALIKSGTFVPLYSLDSVKTKVEAFYLDKYPVSNKDFLAFVRNNPTWQKGKIKSIYADKNYLSQWQGATFIGNDSVYLFNSPVVNVSWFAAKKYCECQGKRLPTVSEWELAGLASETKTDASKDKAFYQKILNWYSKPTPAKLPNVGQGFKNVYGVYDLHGLIWEWTLDFNSALTSGESRSDGSLNKSEFCGAGVTNIKNLKNYAAFMRNAMRASLKANYTTTNLGFRCAKSIKKN